MSKQVLAILIFLALFSGLAMASGEHPKTLTQETDPKLFKLLKEKSIDPKTGLPETLDPNLFRGKAKKAYEIAKEIPEILAQMPCFCECEAYGHENLLDCFIDRHGAGWMICQEEALLTQKLYDQEMPIGKIREEVIKRFK